MNYKIRITDENQAIVKRIADENEMKFNSFDSEKLGGIFLIVNNEITYYYSNSLRQKATLITIEQFIEMFEKKETELEKWLKETKAKNLSLEELIEYIAESMPFSMYHKIRSQSNLSQVEDVAKLLFNQWNNPTGESPKVETEWQPKRGDRVLVWNENHNPVERIFLANIEGSKYPIITVFSLSEEKFLNGEEFDTNEFKYMKPLPIEQPIETDFKSKVIELVTDFLTKRMEQISEECDIEEKYKHYGNVIKLHDKIATYIDIRNEISKL